MYMDDHAELLAETVILIQTAQVFRDKTMADKLMYVLNDDT